MNKAGARAVNLDSPFDRLTTLLCGHFDMPFGLVAVIDGEETIFRSEIGLGEDSMSRRASATNLLVAMGPGASLVIEDAT
ncbi:MAG: hypothetical protein ACOH1H_07600 [Brevundimonas sp.]